MVSQLPDGGGTSTATTSASRATATGWVLGFLAFPSMATVAAAATSSVSNSLLCFIEKLPLM
jgi:hypothetical protein